MDGWLKGLIAVTCVAVIAAISYWFWENRAEKTAMEAAEDQQRARSNCLAEITKDHSRESFVASCLVLGYLTQSDIDRAIARLKSN